MEVYTLSPTFVTDDVIENFESFIWNERYTAAGDTTLKVPTTTVMKNKLKEGTFLWLPGSQEVMQILSQLDEKGILTATGSSLTSFLGQRIVRNTWNPESKYWELTGTPAQIMTEIVRQMTIAGGMMDGSGILAEGAREIIPELAIGNVASGDVVTIAVEYGNVYDQVKKIADTFNTGFKMYPTGASELGYNLIFDTYNGVDRTDEQDVFTPVVFEPASDSLTNVKGLRSIAGYKNVAYAFAPSIPAGAPTYGVAYSDDSILATGFDRRSLLVDASDVNEIPAGTTLVDILNQKAKDALANNNYVKLLDGEIVPQLTYKYGLDYNLGDLISLRSNSLESQKARITEFIRSQDRTGERAYPTLTVISE